MKKILILSFVLCLIDETALAAGTIKIGLICPLTGSWQSEGRVDVLADELNGKGGLLGTLNLSNYLTSHDPLVVNGSSKSAQFPWLMSI